MATKTTPSNADGDGNNSAANTLAASPQEPDTGLLSFGQTIKVRAATPELAGEDGQPYGDGIKQVLVNQYTLRCIKRGDLIQVI